MVRARPVASPFSGDAPASARGQADLDMEAGLARTIARQSHLGARDRFDEPVIEHVERVAAAVGSEARPVAFLHDVVEQTQTELGWLSDRGLTPVERAAIELLTRGSDESYELHVLRIAFAPGPAGRLARAVKMADLDDHLHHADLPAGAPPYRWARRHIARAAECSARGAIVA
jgi:hypothetical protein